MAKFMVVSFDSDESQSFYDFVEAPAASLAMEIVARVRDYADVQDTWRIEDLERVMRQLKADKDTPTTAMELARQLDDGFDGVEWCEKCDCRAYDCVVDHGDTPTSAASLEAAAFRLGLELASKETETL